MPLLLPRCSTWPKGGQPRTNATMWGPGFRYGTPFPRYWEWSFAGKLGSPPEEWFEPSYSEWDQVSPQNILQVYDWIWPTFGLLNNAIFMRWKDIDGEPGFGWHVLDRAIPGMPDTAITQTMWYRQWPDNLNPGDYVVKVVPFINVQFSGEPTWATFYNGRARPDDWTPP